jgi:hypothetical protein
MTATERLAIDVFRSMSEEERRVTLLVIRGQGAPGEITRWLFSDVAFNEEDVVAWMEANYPEPYSVENVPALPLTSDEQFIIERLRAMAPDGLATLAVGLRGFADARAAGRALGPQLGQKWMEMTERIRDLDIPTQRRLLRIIQKDLADGGVGLTPDEEVPEDATLERLLEVVLRLSEEERRQWVYRSLQELRR